MNNIFRLQWFEGVFYLVLILLFFSQCRYAANYKATREEEVVEVTVGEELKSGDNKKADGKHATTERKDGYVVGNANGENETTPEVPSALATKASKAPRGKSREIDTKGATSTNVDGNASKPNQPTNHPGPDCITEPASSSQEEGSTHEGYRSDMGAAQHPLNSRLCITDSNATGSVRLNTGGNVQTGQSNVTDDKPDLSLIFTELHKAVDARKQRVNNGNLQFIQLTTKTKKKVRQGDMEKPWCLEISSTNTHIS